MSAGLRPGQVAEAAGIGREALRYYERRGLVAPAARTLGGHRLYPAETVTRLRIIKAAQRLGFTLEEIADLIEVSAHRHTGSGVGLQERAGAKFAEVDAKIADLTLIRTALSEAIEAGCDDLTECARSSCCPLPFPELAEEDRHDRPST
jgi:DNA-binding transcriptional MerR regulator